MSFPTRGVLRSLRLLGLWVACSAGALAVLMGIEIAADRLIVAAKLQEIGIWGLYVGVALQKIAQTMLNPATASHIAGLPGWLDVALGVTIVAAWGAVTLALIRRLGRAARAQRALVNAPRPVPGRDALR